MYSKCEDLCDSLYFSLFTPKGKKLTDLDKTKSVGLHNYSIDFAVNRRKSAEQIKHSHIGLSINKCAHYINHYNINSLTLSDICKHIQ